MANEGIPEKLFQELKKVGSNSKTHKKIQEAGNALEDAVTKTRTIEKKLDKVQNIATVGVDKVLKEGSKE